MRGFRERQICDWLKKNYPATALDVGKALQPGNPNQVSWAKKKLENLVRKGYVEMVPLTILGTRYKLKQRGD